MLRRTGYPSKYNQIYLFRSICHHSNPGKTWCSSSHHDSRRCARGSYHPPFYFPFLTLFIPSFFIKIFPFSSLILFFLLFLQAINVCCLQSICIVIYPFYFNNHDSSLIFSLHLVRYFGITPLLFNHQLEYSKHMLTETELNHSITYVR